MVPWASGAAGRAATVTARVAETIRLRSFILFLDIYDENVVCFSVFWDKKRNNNGDSIRWRTMQVIYLSIQYSNSTGPLSTPGIGLCTLDTAGFSLNSGMFEVGSVGYGRARVMLGGIWSDLICLSFRPDKRWKRSFALSCRASFRARIIFGYSRVIARNFA